MSSFGQVHLQAGVPEKREVPNANRCLEEHVLLALNKIRQPSTAAEITELLNRKLRPEDRPFQTREIAAWLRNTTDKVLGLYWLENRPRRWRCGWI
jgi:hypothetical protein